MDFSKYIAGKTLAGLLLLFSTNDTAVSFGTYDVARSLTIPGWIVTTTLLLVLVFSITFIARKLFGKSKLK